MLQQTSGMFACALSWKMKGRCCASSAAAPIATGMISRRTMGNLLGFLKKISNR